MAEIRTPPEHQDNDAIAKKRMDMKEKNTSTQEGNPQRGYGYEETTIENPPTGDDWDVQSVEESVFARSFNDERRQSPVPSVMSMKSDQSIDAPVAFAGGCTVNIRVQVEGPKEKLLDESVNTDDSLFCHEREGKGVLCSACPKKALKSCLTCLASFCKTHVTQHYTAPALQRQQLVEATKYLEGRLCQQHSREQELFCKTNQTPVCVAKGHTGPDLTKDGETENFQSNTTQMASQRGYLMSFLDKLGLSEFYPNKLTLRSLLEISSEAVTEKAVKSFKDVPLAFLRKLLMINTKCWFHTSHGPGKAQNNDDDNDIDDEDDSNDDEDDDDDDDDDDKFNPLDLLAALYLCADSFLQQEMSIKMSMCQFAVPFLLPQFGDNPCTLMIWSLRNIYKEWRPHNLSKTNSYVEDSVVKAQIPLLSFVRLNNCRLSKSQHLNYVLSNAQQNHNFFTHRDMNGGNVPKKIANGLVEIAWFLPCGKSNTDVFPDPVAIANMRGDILSNKTQFTFLMKVSAAVFVFLDTMTQEEQKLLDMLGYQKSKLFLVISSKKKKVHLKHANALKLEINHVLRCKLQLNLAESSDLILSVMKLALEECWRVTNVETMSDTACELGICVDEKENKAGASAMVDADKIVQGIGLHQIADYKKKHLPRQGQYLKDIASIEIEECRLQHVGDLSLEEHKTELKRKKCELRKQQGAIKTSQAMKQFIKTMSSKNKEERSFFLRWMALELDKISRKNLTEVRRKIKQVCEEKDRKLISELDQQLLDNSLGTEHYMREMGQIYECKQSDDTKHLPLVAAELLLDGYPIELLNGDVSTIAEKWMTDVLMEVHRKVEHSRLLVVSVLGVQSTGKSTLLNTMFGVQFPVSSGRCTRGAYMLFLSVEEELREELKCDFVLLIDTEGLKSAELADLDSSHEHDNQLATLVIGLSDVTIINIAMENATEMKDVLQIAVHAFLRMKQLGKKPICHFVHQNVSGVSANDKLMTERKQLLEHLNRMTKIAAEMENQPQLRKFTDILDYDVGKNNHYIPGLWHGTPPMAPVNSGYSEAVQDFKHKLLQPEKTTFLEDLSEIPDFLEWMKSLWKAVKHENFIFSFRNTLVAYAYNKLCQEFSEWDWLFRKCIYTCLNNAETQISNTDNSRIEDLVKHLENEALRLIEDQTSKISKKLIEYYKQKDGYVNLIEKYKQEFKLNIKSLQKEMTESVKNNLQLAVSLKRDMERAETLQTQHREDIEMQLEELLKSCQGKSTELSDSDLQEEFEKIWDKVTTGITPLKEKDISSCIMKQLHDNLSHRAVQEELSKMSDLTTYGLVDFKVKIERTSQHKAGNFHKNIFNIKSTESEIQSVAEKTIESCVRYIEGVVGTKVDYQDIHTKEILHIIDTDLKMIAKKTTPTFETDLKAHICGIAARKFLEMHRNFVLDKNPQKHLQKSKKQYSLDFIDSYRKTDQCLRKAQDFTQLCIKPAVTEYIHKSLGIEIVDGILKSKQSSQYSSRSDFQYTILSELLETDDFNKFVRYILNYENFAKDWIDHQVVNWLSKDMCLVNLKSQILTNIIEMITKTIEIVQGTVNNPNDTNEAATFVEKLCHALSSELSLPKNNVREVLFQMTCKCTSFIDSLLLSLNDLKMQLDKEFAESTDIKDTLSTLRIKPQNEIFERVCGCGELCPFCKIPCEAVGKAHTQHFATVHRPQGIGGCMYADTDKLFEVLCTTCVNSGALFQNHATNHEIHPFKKYHKFYPDWSITPDPSIQASHYWKYVLVRYNDKFAKEYHCKPADCPQEWHSITKEQALKGLKAAFNVK